MGGHDVDMQCLDGKGSKNAGGGGGGGGAWVGGGGGEKVNLKSDRMKFEIHHPVVQVSSVFTYHHHHYVAVNPFWE